MIETFRISESALSQRRWALSSVPVIAAAIVALQIRYGDMDLLTSAVVLAGVVVVAIVVARSQYKSFAAFAARHSVEIREDVLVFRDGEVEIRIPYSSISQISVRGSRQAPREATLTLVEGEKETLHGYTDLSRLVEGILEKRSGIPVRVSRWFHD